MKKKPRKLDKKGDARSTRDKKGRPRSEGTPTVVHEQGVCPKCGGTILEYKVGDSILESTSLGYKWICASCKAKGIEWCRVSFIEHELIDK